MAAARKAVTRPLRAGGVLLSSGPSRRYQQFRSEADNARQRDKPRSAGAAVGWSWKSVLSLNCGVVNFRVSVYLCVCVLPTSYLFLYRPVNPKEFGIPVLTDDNGI